MDDVNRSISEYVKSGKYYEDARIWYANRFIFPISERTYALILFSCFAIMLLILVLFYMQIDPAAKQITYINSTDDVSSNYSVILPIGNNKDSPQLRVTKYLLANYVNQRESYSFDSIKDQLSFMRNTTVGSEYLKYENAISINNPDSPIMLFQDTNTKQVKVTRIKMVETVANYQQAMVYFQATLRNIPSNKTISEDYVATINFKIDNIKTLIDQDSKTLSFLVTGYTVNKAVE